MNPLEPEGEPSPARATRDAQFEAFWTTYPRRTAKKAARAAWDKAVKGGVSPADVVNGARRYADDPNRDPQYTKHPATWLNGGCWDDDPLPERHAPMTAQQSIQERNRRGLLAAIEADRLAAEQSDNVLVLPGARRQIGG